DAMILGDTQLGVLDRFLDALRTDAGTWGRAGPGIVGVEATLLQDVRIPNGAVPDRRLFGDEARRTFQRLPAVFVQLPPSRLGGRADAYFFDGRDSRDRRRAYALAGVRADTEVSRSFGRWLHTVAPSVEFRGISRAVSSGGPRLGDPLDTGAVAAGVPAGRR